jgi:hypothetical protein
MRRVDRIDRGDFSQTGNDEWRRHDSRYLRA